MQSIHRLAAFARLPSELDQIINLHRLTGGHGDIASHTYNDGVSSITIVGTETEGVFGNIAEEAAAKALDSGNPAAVQTGPARRGDREVIERHLAILGKESTKGKIYNEITSSIWETSKRI